MTLWTVWFLPELHPWGGAQGFPYPAPEEKAKSLKPIRKGNDPEHVDFWGPEKRVFDCVHVSFFFSAPHVALELHIRIELGMSLFGVDMVPVRTMLQRKHIVSGLTYPFSKK